MTQLARPDPARRRSGQEHQRTGQASAAAAPWPARRSALRAGRPVPGWAVATALLAPAILVGGWVVADALQPAAYSPMRQTMSVLAGHSGTDRWVMTAALLLVGSCQVATGAGLTPVRMPARILLVVTGLSTLGIAVTPEPVTGPTSRHLALAVSCVVTATLWPVLVARRAPAQSPILGIYGCATVTVIFAGLSCWLLIAAQDHGGDLGMVERLTSAAEGLFPLVVAVALRRAGPPSPARGRRLLPGSSGGGAAAALEPGAARPADARGPSRPLEHPDQLGRQVKLSAVDTVPRAGRIGMVHVVPALPERQHGQRPEIGSPVVPACGEGPAPEHMAQGVDTPGDVLQQEDAHEPGPQQREQRAPEAADRPADAERHRQRGGAQRGKRA
jgi:Protein of unknown function (DUF998)